MHDKIKADNPTQFKMFMYSAVRVMFRNIMLMLACSVKCSADQKTGFDISCKLSPLEMICLKYLMLFSEKNKKNNRFGMC